MKNIAQDDDLTTVLSQRILNIVRGNDRDPSLRQLAVLIICNSSQDPQTIRGLAEHLGIPKPAVIRAVDRLQTARLMRRKPDPTDRRSIHLAVSIKGRRYHQSFIKG